MAATVDVRYVKPVVLPRFVAPVARRRAPAALWQRRRTRVACRRPMAATVDVKVR